MRAWPPCRRGLVNWNLAGQFGDLFADALLDLGIADIGENFRDPGADLLHLGFAHAAGVTEGLPRRIPPPFIGGQRIERN